MWKYNYSDELYHYGVKGMKWGVRRNRTTSGSKKTSRRKKQTSNVVNIHDDYRKAHTKKSIQEMSDTELRNRLNRLNMEQQYSRMNPTKIQRGKDIANKTLKTIGTIGATTGSILTVYNNINKIKNIAKK